MEKEYTIFMSKEAYCFPEGIDFILLSEVMQQLIAQEKGWA